MHVHVTVELDGDDLVVVKSATSPGAVERLRAEAARLERAAHPGVVGLLAAGPVRSGDDQPGAEPGTGFELRLAHAGEPVTAWAPPLSGLAGVAAALATTLADLHDAGIVHGRVEATHVLVGADGHPRLCGLAGAPDATPEDDVAGWGRVVADLVTRSRTSRRGVRALARGRERDRRAALAAVTERATDPVRDRRPTARAIADAVVAAVPDAALPRRPRPGRRRGGVGNTAARAPRGHASDTPAGGDVDTLDRIWSWDGEPTEDERWAAVFGAGPALAAVGAVGLPLADRPALGWDRPSGDDRVDEAGPGRGSGSGDSPPPTADGRHPSNPTAETADGRHPSNPTAETADGRHPSNPTAETTDGRHPSNPTAETADGAHPSDPTAEAEVGGAVLDGAHLPTRDHRPVGRMRRRPEAPAPTSSGRRGRAIAVATGVAAVLVAGAWAAAAARERGPGGGADAARSPSSRADCPPVASPAADVDGDGCREALVVDGGTVDAGVAAWTIGETGDLVALGDWNCDGDASPAVLRPGTGDVFVFSTWAALDDPVTVAAAGRVPGGRAIRDEPAADASCDRLVVERTDGTTAEVEVGGDG